ncbi:PREDICTED: apical endosomal glycoprotein [Nipponia nippon]|uniref:apical endosomal glycoprotein n=1 Tax=Nipponia nippon TaxID=128390 RepID=UPI000510C09A|nr:PREDICTED: apical endosomal glycoprotein [Nipponia nippon]
MTPPGFQPLARGLTPAPAGSGVGTAEGPRVNSPSLANRLAINPAAGAGKPITAGLKSNAGLVLGSRFQPRARGVASPASPMPLLAPFYPRRGPEAEMAGQEVLALLLLLAGTIFPGGSTVVNSCSSAAEQLCDFVFSPVVSPVAGTIFPGGSTVVNSCSSAAEQLCDFTCDCSDCSDENQCGYLWGSAALGTPFTCDFEEGDCGWRDVSTSAYRWVRGRASLATWGTGPHSDHTVGTDLGWFMVTVSPWAKTTATAWLRSPVMQEAAATCEIRAWYHLSGSGLNQTEQPVLRLAMVYRDEAVGLWQSPERGGEGWHQLVAYTGRITGQFQLIFSLTQPPACGVELALDDIIFRNCGLQEPRQQVCGAEESACGQGSCLARHRFCDGTDDCGDGSDEDPKLCKSFLRCSFEQDLCNWKAEVGQLAWERNTSLNLGTAYSIPTRDHSNNSRAGFFLHVGSDSAAGASGPAQLSSPIFQATNSCSLVLYCYLHGSTTTHLSISYVIKSTKYLVRERMGDLGSCWVRERVDFNVTDSFKVLIEGVASGTGTVAIDDLILSPGCIQAQEKLLTPLPSRARAGPCAAQEVACDSGGCISAELACDFAKTCADGSDEKRCGATTFEAGPGGWHDVSVGRLRWAVQRATKAADTVLTGAGAFLGLQAGEGQMVAAAKARTPLLGPSGPACTMEMSYHIHGGPQGFLAVSIADHTAGTTQLAWHTPAHSSAAGGHVRIPLGERTRPFQVRLGAQGPARVAPRGSPPPCHPQVELLGLVDLQDSASAAVDNVMFVQCHPNVVPPGAAELTCNFERGMCGWYQDQSSDFQWVHGTGQGQGSDHTTGLGYFLAADPSAPWSRGQRARLITYRQEPAATPHCLSFWYRLAGPQIGTLNLKLWLEGAEETVLWTQRGTQGSIWHRGRATLPATGRRQYRVAFEALRDGFLGDVALDDLALTAGPCGAELSCSFEADACGLVASGQSTWLRQSNSTGTTTGPLADHTTSTAAGHYMVVSTGWGSLPAGRAAALTSQPYQPSAPAQCLAFWYQLSTGTPGSLGVFVEQSGVRRKVMGVSAMEGDAWHRGHVTVRPDGDWQGGRGGGAGGSLGVFVEQSGVRRKVMGVSAMEGDAWHRGHVTVRPDGDWQAIFEAVGAGGDHGYIALDDLHVSDGACPEPVSCDFERDMCGWSSPADPRLHGFAWGWKKSGVPLAKYPGPEQDHTLGTRNGHYVHFDTSVLGPGGITARLESQHLPAAADSCLRFWYHMDIPEHLSSGELRVMVRSATGQRTVWSVAGHRSRGWRDGVVPVWSPSEFQIIFEITTQRWPMEGTVALDDIAYSAAGGCRSSPEVPVEEKSSSGFVAEVALSLLLVIIVLVLVAVGGWYLLKRQGLASGTPAESGPPQGFDNITFRDDKVIISPVPAEGDED